mgnify:CR=1 FL=1
MTKYNMAIAMAEALDLPANHISADTSAPKPGATKRPYDCHLDPTRLEKLGISHQRSFKEAIKICLQPFIGKS